MEGININTNVTIGEIIESFRKLEKLTNGLKNKTPQVLEARKKAIDTQSSLIAICELHNKYSQLINILEEFNDYANEK